jgi:AraC-like DNA-binding protein
MYAIDISKQITCTRFGLMKQVDRWDTVGEKNVTKNMFILLIEGTAVFCLNGTPYHLKQGDMLLIPANTPYTTETSSFCSYYFCHFRCNVMESEFPDDWIRKPYSFSQDLEPIDYDYIYLPTHMELGKHFNRIHHRLINCEEYRMHGTHTGRLLLDTEFYRILLTLAEIVEYQQQAVHPSTLGKIHLYIKQNLTKPLSLQTICKDCNISPSYVERLFKKYMGCTVTEYINNEKLYFACELIRSAHLNLTEIAAYLGYSDVSYFSRRFKRKFGKSPSQMFPKK